MFNKDFKHDVSKQMFARWQAHLAPFDFEIIYKKGEDNHLQNLQNLCLMFDFKHDVSKQMFARWQAHLAPFDF